MPVTSASGSTETGPVGLTYGDSMYIIYIFLVYALIFAVIVATLYWVIRKAVAGGIRDAAVDEAQRQSASLE